MIAVNTLAKLYPDDYKRIKKMVIEQDAVDKQLPGQRELEFDT